MNAAVVHSFDTPPRYASFDDPVPSEREQLVTVTAAGLHRVEKALANGSHYGSTSLPPFIPGVDGVGRLPDGSRVYFGAAGSLAERAAAGITCDTVLILGATGVSGRLAIQIAKRLGAKRVVAPGRHLAGLAELGADAVIPIDRDSFRGEPCDIVLDYLWGAPVFQP